MAKATNLNWQKAEAQRSQLHGFALADRAQSDGLALLVSKHPCDALLDINSRDHYLNLFNRLKLDQSSLQPEKQTIIEKGFFKQEEQQRIFFKILEDFCRGCREKLDAMGMNETTVKEMTVRQGERGKAQLTEQDYRYAAGCLLLKEMGVNIPKDKFRNMLLQSGDPSRAYYKDPLARLDYDCLVARHKYSGASAEHQQISSRMDMAFSMMRGALIEALNSEKPSTSQSPKSFDPLETLPIEVRESHLKTRAMKALQTYQQACKKVVALFDKANPDIHTEEAKRSAFPDVPEQSINAPWLNLNAEDFYAQLDALQKRAIDQKVIEPGKTRDFINTGAEANMDTSWQKWHEAIHLMRVGHADFKYVANELPKLSSGQKHAQKGGRTS